MKKNKQKIKISTVLIYIFFSFMMVLYLAPVAWIAMTSVKTRAQIYKDPFGLPTEFHWENYATAWKAGKLGIAMLNSLFVCVITLILTMLIGSMAVGILVCYAFGTAWFMYVYARKTGPIGLGTALGWCVIPYLLPDAVKIVLASALVGRLYPLVNREVRAA